MSDLELECYLSDPIILSKIALIQCQFILVATKKGQDALRNLLASINKQVIGSAQVLKPYESIVDAGHPLAGEALDVQLAIEELRSGRFIRYPAKPLEAVKMLKRLGIPENSPTYKMLSKNSYKPNNLRLNGNKIELQVHKFEIETPKGIVVHDEKLTYQQNGKSNNFKSSEGARLAEYREDVINELAQKNNSRLQQAFQSIGYQALLGASLSGVLNYQLLLSGEIGQYCATVSKDAAISLMSSGLTEGLRNTPIGDYAGPLVGTSLMVAFNTYNLVQTGDWARFGKDLGRGSASMGASVLTTQGLIYLFPAAAGGPAFAAVAITGMLVGMGTSYGLGKTWFGSKTKTEILRENFLNNQKSEIHEGFSQLGLEYDLDNTAKEFVAKGQVKFIKHDWNRMVTDSNYALSSMAKESCKRAALFVLRIAKARSPSGDVRTGLDLLLDDIRNIN